MGKQKKRTVMKKKEFIEQGQIKIIRKANELVEARYRFDIWEMRVFTKMLMSLGSKDKDLQKYHIHVSEIIKDFNLSDAGDNYVAIKDASNKLLSKIIEIEKETPQGKKWMRIPLLIAVEGFKNREEGNYISVQFHPELKPFLMELKERYLQYDIRNLWGLTSVYSVRMYELLKQYERIGKRYFEVDNLRLILGINPDEYTLYGHFKNKVILKAQKDLQAVTDINFNFNEKKEGRRVVGLTFLILKNDNTKLNAGGVEKYTDVVEVIDDVADTDVNTLFEQIKDWGISQARLKKMLAQYGKKRVENGLQCTLDAISDDKIKGNKGGFFSKAVEENWQSTRQSEKAQIVEKNRQQTEKKNEISQKLRKNEEEHTLLLEQRTQEANQLIKLLTQDDPLIASEAISKITNDKILANLIEKQIGIKIKGLTIDDWRHNEYLRKIVLQQIEMMHPSVFEPLKQQFDENLKRLKRQIEQLKKEID